MTDKVPNAFTDAADRLLETLRTDFLLFSRMAFSSLYPGSKLGDEPYLIVLSDWVAGFCVTLGSRRITSLPPRHLKTFMGTICATAWILGQDPATEVAVFCNNELLGHEIDEKLRTLLAIEWYGRSFPRTKLASERAMDFRTTRNGRVRVVPIFGKFTGIGADVIFIDDPLQIGDAANIERIEEVNARYAIIRSRLNDPHSGRMMLNAHRLHRDDPSGQLIRLGFEELRLPLVATEETTYETSRGVWLRKVGEPLRPKDWTEAEIEEAKAICIKPDFETLYQQNPDNGMDPISADCFMPLLPTHPPSSAPVVLSVDPGHLAGTDNSRTVIQAWCPYAGRNVFLDQFQESCSFATALRNLRKFIGRYQPSVILIENTGYGPGLHDEIKKGLAAKLIPVSKPTRKKEARLAAHMKLILGGGIGLLMRSKCADAFVAELVAFPHGAHDDIVDALTQYLDFMATNPSLPPKPGPRVPVVVGLRSAPRSVPPGPLPSNISVMVSRGAARGTPNSMPWGMPTPIEAKDTHPVLVATLDGPPWKISR